jgi:CheY-like chemotaxis protein
MFAVEIPRVAETQKHGVEPAREGEWPLRFELRDISVLLIEDEQEILQSARLLLEVIGCRVARAMTAREAMERLESKSPGPDLIISRNPEAEFGTRVIQQPRTAVDRSRPARLLTGDTALWLQRESERFDCRILRKPVSPRPAMVDNSINALRSVPPQPITPAVRASSRMESPRSRPGGPCPTLFSFTAIHLELRAPDTLVPAR